MVAFVACWMSQNGSNKLWSGDPKTSMVQAKPKPTFDLAISKLNVAAPVNTDVDPSDEAKYDEALKGGVNHMPGTALPDKGAGNIVIYGHSSSNEAGNYSKVFATLNDLSSGDIIGIKYGESKYNFAVVEKKIIEADDLSVLDQTDGQYLTLLTCWPIGTTDKRLAIIAKAKT